MTRQNQLAAAKMGLWGATHPDDRRYWQDVIAELEKAPAPAAAPEPAPEPEPEPTPEPKRSSKRRRSR